VNTLCDNIFIMMGLSYMTYKHGAYHFVACHFITAKELPMCFQKFPLLL